MRRAQIPGRLEGRGREIALRSAGGEQGFTLVEMVVVTVILITIVTIGLSLYSSSLNSARFTKAKQDLRTISMSIGVYLSKYGDLPKTLYDVGHGGRRDPWSRPYMYLNFHTGTGSGMQFVTANGLVDPDAVAALRNVAPVDAASAESKKTKDATTSTENPPLDAAGVETLKRKDRMLFPLNTDYDLFSVGPNGRSWSSIVQNFSMDDVIRANDGEYYGPAAEY